MGENQLLELTGSVEQVIYRNEKNGYTVDEKQQESSCKKEKG